MDVWRILGIDPTSEPRKIKRAYSKRIALCHPEDDPEGFKALQQAYELALQYAKGELDLDDLEDLEDIEAAFQFAEQLEKELGSFDEGPAQADSEAEADVQIRATPEAQPQGASEVGAALGGEPVASEDGLNLDSAKALSFFEGEEIRGEGAEGSDETKPEPDPEPKPLQAINWRAQRDVFAGFVPEASGGRARNRAARADEGPAVTFTDIREVRQEAAERIRTQRGRSVGPDGPDASQDSVDAEPHQNPRPDTPSFIKDFLHAEDAKERKLLKKMEFHLEELEELVESDGDVTSFFKLGIYARYQEVEGFEERLAAILEDYVQQMNIIEMADLQEAIGYDEDGDGPLAVLFNSRYESTSPLSFIKGIISFIKKA